MRSAAENPLPPLAETCADFRGMAEGENRADRVGEMLTGVIEKHRREVPLRFYTLREVAAFFGVSLNTVQRVYRRLEGKGMLNRVRGFETVIPARVSQRRAAIRGVVAMPIWLPGFVKFVDWRRFYSHLQEELARHRFILEPIFYKQGEELEPEFVERVLKFTPDYLFWHCPGLMDRTVMHSIGDAGVPLLALQNTTGEFPGRIYRLSYERALQQGIDEWKASGKIDSMVIPQAAYHGVANYTATSMTYSGVRAKLPYRFEVHPWGEFPLEDYLHSIGQNPRAGIIFDDDMFFERVCRLLPEEMLQLISRHRVMVVRPFELPTRSPIPEVTVDLLYFPEKLAARQIATDISKGKAGITDEHVLIEAEWHPRTPLREVLMNEPAE